jgi:hypothetical protein
MIIQDTPIPASGLLRLAAAARLAGLTTDVFRAALARGDIPLLSIRIGNLTFVRATALEAWLNPAPTPSPASADLFK